MPVWPNDPFGINPSNWYTQDPLFNAEPQVGYQRFLQGIGRGGDQTPIDQWYNNQYSRLFNTYQAVSPEKQRLGEPYHWMDFLRDYGGSLQNEYNSLSARQRGERVEPWQRLRWVV